MEETSRVAENDRRNSAERREVDLRASLLASLIGEETLPPVSTYRHHDENAQENLEEEEDLFGRIIVQDSGLSRSTLSLMPSQSSLLSSSGLLETPFHGTSSGMFDDIDAEEQRALQLAKQHQLEEDEKRRRKEDEDKQKALEEAIKKEHERQRIAEEREKQRLAKEKEDEQRRLYQEEQKKVQQSLAPSTSSTSGAMRDLRLNDAGDFNRQYENILIHSQVAPIQTNFDRDGLFIGNTAPGTQGGFLAHIADSKLGHLQKTPAPPHSIMTPVENLPTSSLQQAGYGWASYYYSTSGNMQQVVHNPTQRPMIQQNPLTSPSSIPSQGPFVQQPYVTNTAVLEGGLSYAQRSQMRNNMNSSSNTSSQPVPRLQASKTAGMHNTPSYPVSMISNKSSSNSIPRSSDKFDAIFGPITVADPILIQSPGLFAGPPYWSYAISVWQDENVVPKAKPGERVNLSGDAKMISSARRRFRHFVALEERLRRECPGAILPPRFVFVWLIFFMLTVTFFNDEYMFYLDRINMPFALSKKSVPVNPLNSHNKGLWN